MTPNTVAELAFSISGMGLRWVIFINATSASPDARAANALGTGVDTSSGEGSASPNMT